MGKSTISSIIPKVCGVTYPVLKDEFLKVPQSSEEWVDIATQFKVRWNFPNCIGVISFILEILAIYGAENAYECTLYVRKSE